MRTWVTVTLAAVAAALLVVAAAVLILQEDEDGPAPAERFPQTPDEEPEEDDPGRPLETEASIQVTEAWIDQGDCITVQDEQEEEPQQSEDAEQTGQQAQQEEQDPQDPQDDQQDDGQTGGGQQACHRLRVTVTAGADEAFFVGVGLWSAQDTDDQPHNASWVRSPDPVQAGGTRSVVVSFDATDDIRLLQLRYDDPEGRSLHATVGPYEDDMTQEEVASAR